MGLLERYVLRQLVKPFLLGAFVVTFLLTMDFLFDYLDLFLGKGIPFFTVLRLFLLGLGWMLALSIPCGVLVGVLMTYGRMAQDNEVIAVRASGINLARIVRPAVGASILVAGALILFNNYVLPDMNHAFANLMLAVNKKRPTAEIQEGVFINQFSGYSMFIGRLDDRTGHMRDVLIHDFSRKDEPERTILAEHGTLEFDPQSGMLKLHLTDGEVHEAVDEDGKPVYRKMEFQTQTLRIQGSQDIFSVNEGRSRGQREMSIAAMEAHIDELATQRREREEQARRVMERIGVSSLAQLPGYEPPRPWYAPAFALLKRPPPVPALSDSFWTPQRRRLAEEARAAELQARAVEKSIDQYRVEIQKKISIPVACIVFVLVGAPLGVRARRGGLAAGFLSAGFFVFYYLCLVGGEELANRLLLPPWLSMWLPNIVIGSWGLWSTLRACEIVRPRRRRPRMPIEAAA